MTMKDSEIKAAVCTALGIKQKVGEKLALFTERVAVALGTAADDAAKKPLLAALDHDVKVWIFKHTNIELEGLDVEKAKATIAAAPPPAAAVDPAAPKAPKRDATGAVKRAIFAEPGATPDQIFDKLTAAGVKVSKSTVNTVRADFFHTVNVLVGLGAMKPLVVPATEQKAA